MPRMTDQFDLTDDQREIQALARRFTADRITPNAAEWDAKHIFPRDVIKEAADRGFAAIYVSEESGGLALGRHESALILEAMACGRTEGSRVGKEGVRQCSTRGWRDH